MGVAVESYEQARAAHRWDVPERYNIAADACDKHPREKLAMIHEDPDGNVRELDWGELQDMSNRFARLLARARREARRPGGDAPAADAGDRRRVLRDLEERSRSCSSMSVLYGDEGITPPSHRLPSGGRRDERGQSLPRRGAGGLRLSVIEPGRPRRGGDRVRAPSTPPPTTRRSCTTRPAPPACKGHPARAPLHPRPQGVRLLPRRPDGERFHGMGEWAWAAGIAPLIGPWRYGAVQVVLQRRAASTRTAQLAVPLAPPRRRTSSARRRRSARRWDQGCRDALPAALPDRLLGRRAAEPRAIRGFASTTA